MDIVHHAFIGGAGFVALAAQQQELAGLGFLAGSVFPDLDVAFMAGGKGPPVFSRCLKKATGAGQEKALPKRGRESPDSGG